MFSTQAAEGRQGIHRYFTTAMRWGELDPYIVFPDDIEDELDEDEAMQRGLAKRRIGELVHYLRDADDHFFSALTLIVLPRDLDRAAVERDDDEDEEDWDYSFERLSLPAPGRQRIGTLYLSGDVRLFPADGQHRARSARDAIREDHGIAREEVPVVLVPYESPGQVQQLFSDLNLNAKPVSKTVGYDMEQRNPVALLAKRIMEDVELFNGRTNRRSNSLPRSSSNVITLNTLVTCCSGVARALADSDGNHGGVRGLERWLDPDGSRTLSDDRVREVAQVFDVIVDVFQNQWRAVLDGRDGAAGDLRETYVFPHGLGWQALAEAAATLLEADPASWETKFRRGVGGLDWERTADIWRGSAVLYDDEGNNRVNNTGPGVRHVARTVVAAAEDDE